MDWFDFSNSSHARVFGQSALCGQSGEEEWWRAFFIRPIWTLGNRLYNAKWWLMHRLHPKHRYHIIDSGLTPGYYDVDTLILNGCFSLLCRYVEHEHDGVEALSNWAHTLKTTACENDLDGMSAAQGERESEAVALYRWWKFDRPRDQAKYDQMLTHLYGRKRSTKPDENGHLVWSVDEPWTEADEAMNDEFRALERKIDSDEQEMLHRLINVRRSLWA